MNLDTIHLSPGARGAILLQLAVVHRRANVEVATAVGSGIVRARAHLRFVIAVEEAASAEHARLLALGI